jgi:hypothetical protein
LVAAFQGAEAFDEVVDVGVVEVQAAVVKVQ